ncbi:phosphatase PAP2 family protein [Amaricoccus solimangrovi]|uniref:Phosphatase PAP2 family protein n=1 Tax=Amaricoccus solimangrovi TaxID=2589815 RepID=A0A501X0Y1_9RHOB|nr:phosphatase PAP2 family protein [Amaricoccus solimangrovi]TPE53771.1 phosphatase PAP2 family protein [Amaricoccus solimangrovi]
MYHLDVTLTRAINGLAGGSAAFDALMIWTSRIGVPLLVLAVALRWWRGADRRHSRHVLVAAGLTFLLGLFLNQIIVHLVHRVRPYDAGVSRLLIERSADVSFPSDHATATVAIAAAFLLHGTRRMGLAFGLAALLVCFSRIYVGTHYAGDVLGGALTAVLAALLVARLYTEGTRLDRIVTGIL